MTDEKKPRYRLEKRSDNYVTLWDGYRCMCAICTNTPRGALDAQLLLRAVSCHEDLLDLVKRYAAVLKEGHSKCANAKCVACIELEQVKAAIESTKPEQESGSTL